jgi:2'-hydroxyisoflavone reductase
MDVLILGGTIFLGRHLIDAALARGHRVTIFHRGQHPFEPSKTSRSIEDLHGDRHGDLAALAGRRWDAVIDTSGYTPGEVRHTASRLSGRAGQYLFISSISAYGELPTEGLDETAPAATISDADLAVAETLDREDPVQRARFFELYGPLKAACERAVGEAFAGVSTVIRPGLIVGPHDPTDRFTYWPVRFARGGDVIVPGPPERPIQLIDARDLAEWTIALVERSRPGLFNATSPAGAFTMGTLVASCMRVASDARPLWVPGPELVEAGVTPWVELPLWLGGDESMRGLMSVSVDRAVLEGLTIRPLDVTVRDTLDGWRTQPADRVLRAGLAPEREAELISRWKAGAISG